MKHIKLFENFKVGSTQEIKFHKYTGHIVKQEYNNGRVALEMVGTGKHEGEPILVATINVPNEKLAKDEVIIKNYSENQGILDVLVMARIISAPIRETENEGFPICKLLI